MRRVEIVLGICVGSVATARPLSDSSEESLAHRCAPSVHIHRLEHELTDLTRRFRAGVIARFESMSNDCPENRLHIFGEHAGMSMDQ